VLEIRKYRRPDSVIPFDRWIAKLRDARAKARVLVQLDRLALGLAGDWKSVGEGIFELRIFEGKGYRVYFARDGETVVILLCGGDKSTQDRDIKLAKSYWQEYRRRT
jgi:putative addiction module killer protein